jgi:SPP1 gp7 family putative phage head morphogenesis protein
MKRRAANQPTDLILRRTILTSEAIAAELRERLADAITSEEGRGLLLTEVLDRAREILREYEPLLADLIENSELFGWVAGYSHTAERLPPWLQDVLRRPDLPPPRPPKIVLPGLLGDADEPELRFPILEKAAESLIDRDILRREDYDRLTVEARQRAFTVAGDLTADTIETIRDTLAADIQDGTSLTAFRNRIKERLDTSPIGRWHLETVYRTNVQAAFRDGRESLANNPIVSAVFPYQEYLNIHDGRTRDEHAALETLGLDGTAVYRRDDPVWELFTPPWDFNCRCGVNLLTVEAAARRGVREAKRWLDTGQAPLAPEHRLEAIPFRPPAGFGTRGRRTVGVA